MQVDPSEWSHLVVGSGLEVRRRPDGGRTEYVNFDNAASTPALRSVADFVYRALPWYASVHRGSGIKSRVMTELYEGARQQVRDFFHADPDRHEVVFTRNTTEALNLFAHIAGQRGLHIVTTAMEHHSNMLPWRRLPSCTVLPLAGSGFDLSALQAELRTHPGPRTVVAVTGASNVTGAIPPLQEISRLVHHHGARLLLDAAQLAAHRPIAMDDPEARIDALACSGHKAYAPFGAGALVGLREWFEDTEPLLLGGGVAELVTSEQILFARGPDRHEGGSPNVLGVLAMGEALSQLRALGLPQIAAHERDLVSHLHESLASISGLRIYGNADTDRVGVVSLSLGDLPHALVAEILGRDWGIGVRSGCFCAHPYVMQLLGLDEAEVSRSAREHPDRSWRADRGLVRISFGLYNTRREIDRLAQALGEIASGGRPAGYQAGLDGNYHTPDEDEWVRRHIADIRE